MAGVCKYCGFVGTNDEKADHAGSCPVWLEDYQPDLVQEDSDNKECSSCHGSRRVSISGIDYLCGCSNSGLLPNKSVVSVKKRANG